MKALRINVSKLESSMVQAITELKKEYPLQSDADGIAVTFVKSNIKEVCCTFKNGIYEVCADTLPHFYWGLSMLLLKSQTIDDRILYNRDRAVNELLFEAAPFFNKNGLMLDLSRNAVGNVPTMKRFIRQLAFMGHSWYMLYMEDVYEVEGEPYFGALRGRYSISDMRDMDAYARLFGIDLVPCIQTLAHVNQFFMWEREESKYKDIDDVLNVGSEAVKSLLERMIASLRKAFSTNTIHIGMDEAYHLGRGKYLDENGLKTKPAIMLEHLDFMKTLCKKYGFMPIIWDDMFFMHYSHIDENAEFQIPDDIGLMYWDYYNCTVDHYIKRIEQRSKIASELIFAGGAWRWTGYIPHHKKTLESTIAALAACRQKDIKTVITTAWSDDGSEAPLYTSMFGTILYAYLDFNETYCEHDFDAYLRLYTGIGFDEWMLQGEADLFNGSTGKDYDITPSKYLLYQDPLGSKFLHYIQTLTTDMDAVYTDIEKKFALSMKKNTDIHLKLIAEFYMVYMQVLRLKWRLPLDIWERYHAGDKPGLSMLISKKIRPLKRVLHSMADARRKIWMDECNAFGSEVLDHRFGGMLMRLDVAEKQITAFVNGDIAVIGELEEDRLDPCPEKDKEQEPQAVFYNRALRIMSAGKEIW